MNQRTIVIAVALFILIVAGMFTFAFMKKNELVEQEPVVEDEAQEEVEYASVTRITGKHYFIDGVHTIAGEIPMPTPCDLLEVEAMVMESMPEQVALDFTVINNAEFCAQVVTPQRFMVSATASEAATFSATFMGRPVELNLVPAGEGETPEDFELFIKG
jgi:hypothetical protein